MEVFSQLMQFLSHLVLRAQAYGEGTYGGLRYGSTDSTGGFNLPLPNTGPGLLFWGGAILLAVAVGIFAWRFFAKRRKRSTDQAAAPSDTDQLLKY
ncbi:hypothetical protein EPO04_03550 [Patescibacteria group bacterium]|nr:MAG: hypothetical protein EPO04_03550 [Patescibacteria group bacterium]